MAKNKQSSYTGGRHNQNLDESRTRLMVGSTYKDLSTICIIPVPAEEREVISGTQTTVKINGIDPTVLQSWWALLSPMNQKFLRIFARGFEVADAYNQALGQILSNPELSKFKYILTMEWDNMPPPDGLLKLYEGMDKYDVVGGLYWTKGEGGQPMIYGNPSEMPMNFIPQLPVPESLQRCNGLGMGFTLFKTKIFKDDRIPKPWFKTKNEYIPGVGTSVYTQDLWFFQQAGSFYKFACDTRVKVGHYDPGTSICW